MHCLLHGPDRASCHCDACGALLCVGCWTEYQVDAHGHHPPEVDVQERDYAGRETSPVQDAARDYVDRDPGEGGSYGSWEGGYAHDEFSERAALASASVSASACAGETYTPPSPSSFQTNVYHDTPHDAGAVSVSEPAENSSRATDAGVADSDPSMQWMVDSFVHHETNQWSPYDTYDVSVAEQASTREYPFQNADDDDDDDSENGTTPPDSVFG